MKKYVLMLMMLVFAGFMTASCEKEDSDEMEDEMMVANSSSASKTIAVEDLPTVITDYIATNYPDAAITKAEQEDDGSYEVYLDNGLEVEFDMDGNFLKEEMDDDEGEDDDDKIAVEDLPSVITDYIAANYPGTTIVEAEREDDGGFEVELDNGLELEFDADGNFVEAEMEDDDDDDGEDDDDGDDKIAVEDLPVVITDYIAANYPGTTIVEAEREDDGGYEVELDNGIELEFDADGNFIKED